MGFPIVCTALSISMHVETSPCMCWTAIWPMLNTLSFVLARLSLAGRRRCRLEQLLPLSHKFQPRLSHGFSQRGVHCMSEFVRPLAGEAKGSVLRTPYVSPQVPASAELGLPTKGHCVPLDGSGDTAFVAIVYLVFK